MVAAAQENCFNETSGVISDLFTVFDSRDDAAKVAHVRGVAAEMAHICQAREGEMQSVIRDLTRSVAVAEREAAPGEDPEAHAARMAAVEADKCAAEGAVAQMEEELRRLGGEKAAAHGRLCDAEAVRADADAMESEALPRAKHELSLYAHVSKVIWHSELSGRVCGNVSDPANADIRPFDMDPRATSQYEIANKLWGLMDGEVEGVC